MSTLEGAPETPPQGAAPVRDGGAIQTPPDVVVVHPAAVLDRFPLNSDQVQPHHVPAIATLATRIVESWRGREPVRSVRLVGHTDPAGAASYNLALGERRARAVGMRLAAAVRAQNPRVAAHLKYTTLSLGESRPRVPNTTPAGRALNRRVEIFCSPAAAGRRESSCGVPSQPPAVQRAMEMELQELERAKAPVAVTARLSIFENAPVRAHRNHFECGAGRWATRVSAYASPDASACSPRRVGATPYDSGADIIASIDAAARCLETRLVSVHIFSHSGHNGLYGPGDRIGLYSDTVTAAERTNGARHVTDVPAARLAQNVIIVLHGCNTAAGDDNFARSLFQHLTGSLTNPRVYGHFDSGCASRDNNWKEYSNAHPAGRRLARLGAIYSDVGCCG